MGYIAGPKFNFDAKFTEIIYITEHEFINQMINDQENFLTSFETFLIDEAHELRKSTMIILAILRNFIKKHGTKHKLIVTSATLDTKIFQEYFKELKVSLIEAVTPTFSVESHYTYFPDLSTSIVENTAAHLRIIFEVSIC